MPGGRSSKPLFELLRDQTTGRRAPAARPPGAPESQAPLPEVKPVTRPPFDPDAEPPADAPAPHRARLLEVRGETVQVSRYTALVACAVVLGLIFSVYLIAYSAGRDRGAKDFTSRVLTPDSPPSATPPPAIQTSVPRPTEPVVERRADVPPPPGAGSPKAKTPPERPAILGFDDPTRPVLTATGAVEADPREPGLNYLVLATLLTREDARQLVSFLGTNGLDAVGVPTQTRVESGGRAANNPGSYKVVSRAGLTSEQFKASDPRKARLQAEAIRLGELWKSQNRPTIIKDTYWELLKP